MLRNSKRKASAINSSIEEGRAAKKSKAEHSDGASAAPSNEDGAKAASELGLRFIEHIKKSVDKNHRPIATAFLSLPDKREVPDYYEIIKLPVSIETIQQKLEDRRYASLSEVESDVKRMERNAKEYNETGSTVYLDAERIRKATLNWMQKMNPAHKKGGYTVVPTPLPPEPEKRLTLSLKNNTSTRSRSAERERKSQARSTPNGAATTSDAGAARMDANREDEAKNKSRDFFGKDFQQAQEQLIADCLEHVEDGQGFSSTMQCHFADLPPRSTPDYYAIIKHPAALKTVRKRIRGNHGRAGATGITDFKSWDSFEAEVRRIWENAREFNEDESAMFQLAGKLEDFFKQRLDLAKKTVDERAQPTLKLNMGTKPTSLKLRLGAGSPRASPGLATTAGIESPPAASSTALGTTKSSSENVKSAPTMNGAKQLDQSAASIASTSNAKAVDSSLTSTANGIKSSPALQTVSGTGPSPPHLANGISTNSHGPSASPRPPTASGSGLQHVPYYTPPTGLQSKWRANGKDASNALFTRIDVVGRSSQHSVNGGKPISMSVLPTAQLSQQSITISMPSTHTTLELEPHLSSSLAIPSNTDGRPYKLFVACNGKVITPARQRSGDGTTDSTHDANRLRFEIPLAPGMNRIEVEIVTDSKPPGHGLELERCSIFANLTR
ncbi:MAG: hypothetical protein M1828_001358 [Chrysothrix sp. TS-e1954]|nr:MAG: hypothetical protein M1828_001358 [Chrysothrix sp. TS-e1954]